MTGISTATAATSRICHGYGKTHGFMVMGFVGTGTVPDLA